MKYKHHFSCNLVSLCLWQCFIVQVDIWILSFHFKMFLPPLLCQTKRLSENVWKPTFDIERRRVMLRRVGVVSVMGRTGRRKP